MKIAGYLLSTVNGFDALGFGDGDLRNRFANLTSSLDLDSGLGIAKAQRLFAHAVFRDETNDFHVYSAYRGTLELEGGRLGSFLGVAVVCDLPLSASNAYTSSS